MDCNNKLSISLSYSRGKYNKMCDSQQSVHFVQTNDLKSIILKEWEKYPQKNVL